jgi:hypothetical protein
MNLSQSQRPRIQTLVEVLLLVLAAALFAAHYLHLSADFPNHSPWMDWAKYTDEGWYGDAAIRHIQRGSWNVPGDFNPAAALPVWPLLELAVFHFTGVSLISARALSVTVFGLILLVSYLLLRRGRPNSLAPAAAILLLATSPFCYAFTRLAILEPLLILLTLLALTAASFATPDPKSRLRDPALSLALGLLLPLMILTKTTAVFLLPAVAWMLWASTGYRLRSLLRVGIPAAGLAATLWLAYFGLLIRPHFLADYRYLFSANAYTGITRDNAVKVLADTIMDGLWMGTLLYPLGVLIAILVLVRLRRFLMEHDPLVPALLLWTLGYLAFLAYHNNLQPRYYLVVAVPLTLFIPLAIDSLLTQLPSTPSAKRIRTAILILAAADLAAITVTDASQTLHFLRTPQYTFLHAAQALEQVVHADPTHSPLVLSISGSDLSLMTGLPSICDDFGTMELPQRIATYHPGWYATWNEVDDDKMDALAPFYHLSRVAAFPAMDDPERNLLILYRLDPPVPEPQRPQHRRTTPRLLQTRLGQQPSTSQLEH